MHIEPAYEPCGCAHSRDFLAGFIGPRVLGPDSNIGPIIGLLFSGPPGAGLGAGLRPVRAVSPALQPGGAAGDGRVARARDALLLSPGARRRVTGH